MNLRGRSGRKPKWSQARGEKHSGWKRDPPDFIHLKLCASARQKHQWTISSFHPTGFLGLSMGMPAEKPPRYACFASNACFASTIGQTRPCMPQAPCTHAIRGDPARYRWLTARADPCRRVSSKSFEVGRLVTQSGWHGCPFLCFFECGLASNCICAVGARLRTEKTFQMLPRG